MLVHASFRDFSSAFSVDLTPAISSLNSLESSAICVCRLEKLFSIRDSMAVNLSRSISMEISESVSAISLPFCLFRFGVGLSAELELDERSERFDMNTGGQNDKSFLLPVC